MALRLAALCIVSECTNVVIHTMHRGVARSRYLEVCKEKRDPESRPGGRQLITKGFTSCQCRARPLGAPQSHGGPAGASPLSEDTAQIFISSRSVHCRSFLSNKCDAIVCATMAFGALRLADRIWGEGGGLILWHCRRARRSSGQGQITYQVKHPLSKNLMLGADAETL